MKNNANTSHPEPRAAGIHGEGQGHEGSRPGPFRVQALMTETTNPFGTDPMDSEGLRLRCGRLAHATVSGFGRGVCLPVEAAGCMFSRR